MPRSFMMSLVFVPLPDPGAPLRNSSSAGIFTAPRLSAWRDCTLRHTESNRACGLLTSELCSHRLARDVMVRSSLDMPANKVENSSKSISPGVGRGTRGGHVSACGRNTQLLLARQPTGIVEVGHSNHSI